MSFPRAAGILLHPTSLPGPNGIGELGPDAFRFVDTLAAAGMKLWQMLPLGPTGYGDSPYQCLSAFAGNPLLIHLPDDGTPFPAHEVDFARVIPHKRARLRAALDAFVPDERYHAFVHEHAWWLEDFALFVALKDAHDGRAWTEWEPGAARREAAALETWRARLAEEIERHRRAQFVFFEQFTALKRHCAARGVRLMGDLPIYVAHDSADVWAGRALFQLHDDGSPRVQAGVPPDYFSATGQLWGNPVYDWDRMRADGYAWWIRRFRYAFAQFDVVRLDHFRGFESYWEVPGADTTAMHGRWVQGPGAELFRALTAALGSLPIVAENLGLITPEVESLRAQFALPGMGILHFAFGNEGEYNQFLPHNHVRELVVYTGTHDNDTTVGWWTAAAGEANTRSADAIERERDFVRRYLATDGHDIQWTLIRTALASVAHTALIPMQDVLGLSSEARMNLPGRPGGNWRFRFSWDQLHDASVERLASLARLYDR
ncbi:MAG: 4-alpha-glucanotransferase [Gemmatimonadaceae bacterium]|nr:4-alpha-glucanotransferase [Gemmatimonadaceae bacterium]